MRTYRGHDWVSLGTNFYSPADGVFLDRPKGQSGSSFWYDVLPNVLFSQLTDLYPDEAGVQGRMFSVAERWYQACVAFGGSVDPPALPNFDHTGFNLRTMQPFDNGERIEPEEGPALRGWNHGLAEVQRRAVPSGRGLGPSNPSNANRWRPIRFTRCCCLMPL